ncbi:hypothetical protein KL905_003687 [Ogataea polymorpha]|uniref:uncharacterized protein n=1 Tax=Ogataea polymorpha TaxID=460523 RepID=UPI0007F431A8|nr:uncharacterized protein OGAPODRAFT_95663 [Ogataea polymorpha]KAG7878918.1 hypothetical protein KL937_003331 [Ogataea polymorpha]KAG7899237.1 hypothetical protein KL935_003547 [Ogataea polymorpha]KAG7907770.1 hypothetical protein KL906_003851 [Ogataea polymorpha]KAG7915702.1 hypothetical protein KL927_003978 [Ogataea polymorpha]KAG7919822.1 hypothetical protein KL905_003687 [Ogataea polymorpha]
MYSILFNDYGKIWRESPTAVNELFAFGTIADYKANKQLIGPLDENQLLKLRQLTLMSVVKQGLLTFDQVSMLLDLDYNDIIKTLTVLARSPLLELEIDELGQTVKFIRASSRDIWVQGDPSPSFTKPITIELLQKELNYGNDASTPKLKRRLES